jgi:hypothetical protein
VGETLNKLFRHNLFSTFGAERTRYSGEISAFEYKFKHGEGANPVNLLYYSIRIDFIRSTVYCIIRFS